MIEIECWLMGLGFGYAIGRDFHSTKLSVVAVIMCVTALIMQRIRHKKFRRENP